MNKTITYNLNEANLRAVFEQYEVGFDETHWAETEKTLESVGFQPKDILTAKAKKLVFFCCLVVVGGSLAAFINFNTHKESTGSQNLSASAITEEITGIKIESELGLMNLQRKATALTAATAIVDSVKPEPSQLAINENAGTTEKKTETELTPVQTPEVEKASEVKTEPKKKKRKKRRTRSENSDMPAPVTHAPADDDVIIGD